MSGTTSGAVAFDYALWSARYPEFSCVSPSLAEAYFHEAGLYLANDGTSRVGMAQRAVILGMITAHIAALAGQSAQAAQEGSIAPVGRMSSVSEGSDSVSFDLQVPGTAGWWVTTSYGLAAWTAMAPLRTMRYFPGRRRY